MDSFVASVVDVMHEAGDARGDHPATRLALLDVQDGAIKFAADVSQHLRAPVDAAA